MRAVDVIAKKRDGLELTKDEIDFFIAGFTRGEITDYQAAAWAMAVYLRGMNEAETTALTLAMAHSGSILDLSSVSPRVLDKHSSGGVGDKVTLVVGPLIASLGLPFGKMSGRGLGFSGGTLDKLESIPGFRVELNTAEYIAQLKQTNIVVSGQTHDLAPADGKLYALRDVTSTVGSLPLIASSIMSKKIAAGAQVILLDVKVGRGAFMKTEAEAIALAELMVKIGKLSGQRIGAAFNMTTQSTQASPGTGDPLVDLTSKVKFISGRRVAAIISDMNQPLGNAVGNALEVIEAIETLKGRGPIDFTEHCLTACEELVLLAGAARDKDDARAQVHSALNDGRALRKFSEWIDAQGGAPQIVDDYSLLPHARIVEEVRAPRDGFIAGINAEEIGWTVVDLGGGRAKKSDAIDHAVGVVFKHKVGERIAQGEALLTLHANDRAKFEAARARLLAAYEFSERAPAPVPLIHKVIR